MRLASHAEIKDAGHRIEAVINRIRFASSLDDGTITSERVFLFYRPSLERLGITVTVRTVDDVPYQNRLRMRDFDVVIATWEETLSPGNEQTIGVRRRPISLAHVT